MTILVSSSSKEEKNIRDYISKLWHGEVSLAKTYWVFYVLAWVILGIVARLVGSEIFSKSNNLDPYTKNFVLYFMITIFMTYQIFISVAIWRSANNYKVMFGKKIRAYFAQGIAVVAVLSNIGATINIMQEVSNTQQNGKVAWQQPQINQGLPRQIDAITTLSKIDDEGGNLNYYFYVSQPVNQFGLISTVRSTLVKSCNDDAVKEALRVHNFVMYIYTDVVGLITKVAFSKKDCI